jgi:hypothetical protein
MRTKYDEKVKRKLEPSIGKFKWKALGFIGHLFGSRRRSFDELSDILIEMGLVESKEEGNEWVELLEYARSHDTSVINGIVCGYNYGNIYRMRFTEVDFSEL